MTPGPSRRPRGTPATSRAPERERRRAAGAGALIGRFLPPLALMGADLLPVGPAEPQHRASASWDLDPAQGRPHDRVRPAVVPLVAGAGLRPRCAAVAITLAYAATRRVPPDASSSGRHGTPVDVGDRRGRAWRCVAVLAGAGGPPLQPAALGGVQDGLRAVDGAELAVDVVQVRAHRAGGERELVRDLLVDHALGEALEDLELARRRAGTARPRAGGPAIG